MAVRYAKVKPLDFCFHPLKVLRDGEFIHVPCGKCDGCLLFKANSWSQRLSYEIENNPFSIFFTLTYSNKYLPTLVAHQTAFGDFIYDSDHPLNIRFDGSKDVLREDHIIIHGKDFIPIQNDDRKFTVNYVSKRDVQLWLKLLRKDIHDNLLIQDEKSEYFRYYIISEIGPTTHRGHVHGVLFPRSQEIAEYLVSVSMFKSWQMSSEFLFRQYCKYCDAGTATYVSNYVSGNTKLPAIYKNDAIKPFRLSSKRPAIGFRAFNTEEIFEKVSQGIITYNRQISRIGQTSVLGFPSTFMHSLFPKCYRYGLLPYSRLLWIYGIIYREVTGYQRPCVLVSSRLRKDLHASDYQAALRCYQFCRDMGSTPFHYLYLVDMYYYKQSMTALSRWYTWQESVSAYPVSIILSYTNLTDYVSNRHSLSCYQKFVVSTFFEQFGIDFDSLDYGSLIHFSSPDPLFSSYVQEVQDIVSNLDKSKKVNELTNSNPHII